MCFLSIVIQYSYESRSMSRKEASRVRVTDEAESRRAFPQDSEHLCILQTSRGGTSVGLIQLSRL